MAVRPIVVIVGALAVSAAGAQRGGPVPHDLGAVVATSVVTVLTAQIVPISNGRVFIADPSRRMVHLLDANLANPRLVFDSIGGRQNSYTVGSFILPFRGDSVFLLDRVANALVLFDPSGAQIRTVAPPPVRLPSANVLPLSIPFQSTPKGLVYTVAKPGYGEQIDTTTRPLPGQPDIIVLSTADLLVLRMNYDTRVIDTIGVLNRTASGGGVRISATTTATYNGPASVFRYLDEHATTSDGSVALLRAREYRVEFVDTAGRHIVGPRLTYPGGRITDAERDRLVDSINAQRRAAYDSMLARRALDSAAGRGAFAPGAAGGAARGGTGAGGVATSGADALANRTRTVRPPEPVMLAVADDIPSYYPPTDGKTGAFRADADNNVWIRLRRAAADDANVWEVIDRRGELIDRVRIPINKTLAGFGPGGFVFLLSRDGGIAHIDKVRVR